MSNSSASECRFSVVAGCHWHRNIIFLLKRKGDAGSKALFRIIMCYYWQLFFPVQIRYIAEYRVRTWNLNTVSFGRCGQTRQDLVNLMISSDFYDNWPSIDVWQWLIHQFIAKQLLLEVTWWNSVRAHFARKEAKFSRVDLLRRMLPRLGWTKCGPVISSWNIISGNLFSRQSFRGMSVSWRRPSLLWGNHFVEFAKR